MSFVFVENLLAFKILVPGSLLLMLMVNLMLRIYSTSTRIFRKHPLMRESWIALLLYDLELVKLCYLFSSESVNVNRI